MPFFKYVLILINHDPIFTILKAQNYIRGAAVNHLNPITHKLT